MGFQCSIICFGCENVLVMGAYIIMNCILWCLHRGFGEVWLSAVKLCACVESQFVSGCSL